MKRFLCLLFLVATLSPAKAEDPATLAKPCMEDSDSVDSFPDYKVQVVNAFADLKVKNVTAFPDSPGEWQIVDAFPDYKIQFVDSFPDFKIQYVESFPGPVK